MAKRKRLTPAQDSYLSGSQKAAAAPSGAGPAVGPSVGAAPIAQVASEASATAALEELSGVLENARARGLMIEELALDVIDETYLVRDRIEQDEDEMQALIGSLRARGQQTPIEVARLDGGRYGLISGWRRLTALRRLYDGDSESEFARVKALVVRPESAADAYVAMVEENEIRVNLSHYERARIAMRALAEGVYPDQRKALLGLFINVPRAKRSKIASFVPVVAAFDPVLRYPTAISEKLGLQLARALESDPDFGDRARAALVEQPAESAEVELALLARLAQTSLNPPLEPSPAPVSAPSPTPKPRVMDQPAPTPPRPRLRDAVPQTMAGERILQPAAPGVQMGYTPDAHKIELMGPGVDEALMQDLRDWLAKRR